MKRFYALKSVFLLLLVILILNSAACTKSEKDIDYDPNLKLNITEKAVEYSDEDLADAKVRFTELSLSLIQSYSNINLNEKQKQKVSDAFDTTVIPIIYSTKIYKNELDTIFAELEKYADSDGIKNNTKPILFSIYEICSFVLGTERSGHLTYEASIKILESKANTALEKYEKYGYDFYKKDFDRCTLLALDLKEMGEEKLTDALSMISIVISTASSINKDSNENSFALTDAELLYILDKQGEILNSQCLTEDDWHIFGGLISEFIPNKNSSLNSATLYALKNYTYESHNDAAVPNGFYKNFYFSTSMKVMPKIIALFADFTKALKTDGTFSLESTQDEKLVAVCSSLLQCEDSIRSLDLALNNYAKLNPDDLKIAVSKYSDIELLDHFIETTEPIFCDDLIDIIKSIASGNIISKEEFHDVLTSYVYNLSPYLAFVLYINL